MPTVCTGGQGGPLARCGRRGGAPVCLGEAASRPGTVLNHSLQAPPFPRHPWLLRARRPTLLHFCRIWTLVGASAFSQAGADTHAGFCRPRPLPSLHRLHPRRPPSSAKLEALSVAHCDACSQSQPQIRSFTPFPGLGPGACRWCRPVVCPASWPFSDSQGGGSGKTLCDLVRRPR